MLLLVILFKTFVRCISRIVRTVRRVNLKYLPGFASMPGIASGQRGKHRHTHTQCMYADISRLGRCVFLAPCVRWYVYLCCWCACGSWVDSHCTIGLSSPVPPSDSAPAEQRKLMHNKQQHSQHATHITGTHTHARTPISTDIGFLSHPHSPSISSFSASFSSSLS